MTHRTKLYFSGSMTHPHVVERLTMTNVHRLFTFAAPKEVHEYLHYCDQRGRYGQNIMVDSGAFTAWNIGKPVQLRNLIEYDLDIIAKYPHHNFTFIALDVIPGSRGVNATETDIARAIEQSMANFDTMQQALRGQVVLPVFHTGEGKWLRDHYLSKTDQIAYGMNQNLSENQRFAWAREHLVPGIRTHGLAATGNKMLTHVDWYSVDSSGWLMTAAMGSILFPIGDRLRPLSVSDTAPNRKVAGQHITTMSEAPWIREYIKSKGYDPDRMMTDYAARICWNIDQWNAPPWVKDIVPAQGLF